MKEGKARFSGFLLVALAALALFLVPNTAKADALYDDLVGTTIDPSKWTAYLYGSSTDLFTVGGGTLNFSSSTASSETLITTQRFSGNFWITVHFTDFSSTTTYPSGYTGFSSGISFGLGPKTNRIHFDLFHSPTGDYLSFYEMNDATGTYLRYVGKVAATSSEGVLLLNYYDGWVNANYYLGSDFDPSNPTFTWLGAINPNWGSSYEPTAFLFGSNHTPGATSVEFDNIRYGYINPVPVPATILLLAPGLAALIPARRRQRRR